MDDREGNLPFIPGGEKQNLQLQILAELNGVSRVRIIGILLRNGETVSSSVIKQLYKRLETLEAQISEREKEYLEIAQALSGKETR